MGDVRGRFAPSPTGELHVGSLRTALVACSRRVGGGKFVLRVEDLDRERVRPGFIERQLAELRHWAWTGTRVRTWWGVWPVSTE